MPTIPVEKRTKSQRKYYMHQSRPAQRMAREAERLASSSETTPPSDIRMVVVNAEAGPSREEPKLLPVEDIPVVVAQEPEVGQRADKDKSPGASEPEYVADSGSETEGFDEEDAISVMASDEEI